jgi:predicted ABC-class ATPase
MKNSYGMSTLPASVLADTSPEPSGNFDHAEHTPEPIHEEIDSEAPRRSKRSRIAKSFGDDFTIYLVDDSPKTIVKAFASLDADDWKEAVHSEMDSILSNETWELVHRPYGC